ncbi:hypothetical protein EZV73_00845 [Acidaminobacter sp. JC074]|uniref:hypothetical protein n=1 Tax=Acidaminobacter sp. JC074 TaxID=2530199 RepID=UPI001F1019E7|nr:hypothetical protein [Acidaminobacter sp. JC074]MCH4886088.1 hypothetical protein [Acidaminobacter sp. JC074]
MKLGVFSRLIGYLVGDKRYMLSKVKGIKRNFSSFAKTMHLDELEMTKSEYKEIEVVFNEIKSYEVNGEYSKCNHLWDMLIAMIDLKVTEKNYRHFYESISEYASINEKQLSDIKRLYFLTDYYALNGRTVEAKASWKMLMMILKNEVKDFVPKSLNDFDGAIPKFS